MDEEKLLEIKDLQVRFYSDGVMTAAIDDVNLYVNPGETLGVAGESGCGKSVTAMSILQLIPNPPGKIENGEIIFKGEDLLKKTTKEMRHVRGKDISMIFQEPMTSLNPVFTVGRQITETILVHQDVSKAEANAKAIEMLKLVGIPLPEQRMKEYPHQLSGGMRQRVMIAIALSCKPALLIADEPTTALDVTIQAQILDLMRQMKDELGMSIIFITHDMGVIAEMSDRVAIMYAGRIVEQAAVEDLFAKPVHPYTAGLLNSITKIGNRGRLDTIRGVVPEFSNLPKGCRFCPRCDFSITRCEEEEPVFEEIAPGHFVSCFRSRERMER
ncbi:MAG: ABC transporter ATP-binding protein [Clostridiales Family XIII bacterium]|jgi:oligopeptide/dipeptide ABC transporter ATP-binding protein|nr:ABC transporter ATP-binding protein [Clostridiales Family XIII bacterium]